MLQSAAWGYHVDFPSQGIFFLLYRTRGEILTAFLSHELPFKFLSGGASMIGTGEDSPTVCNPILLADLLAFSAGLHFIRCCH